MQRRHREASSRIPPTPTSTPTRHTDIRLQHILGNRALLAEIARARTTGSSVPLPFAAEIQASFGRHRVLEVRAHLDARAAAAAATLGAKAFTSGDRVAFAGKPTLFTAAHEAAHVIQQRAGVRAEGHHEESANAVAARVVHGQSSESLLDAYTPSASPSTGVVQCEHESDIESFAKTVDVTEVFPNAQKLRNGIVKLVTIGKKLEKQGKGYLYDDKQKLASASFAPARAPPQADLPWDDAS